MPVVLHHGPASLQKQQTLIELVRAELDANRPTLMILPNKALVSHYKARIIKTNSECPVHLGTIATTWDEFLLKNLKHNHHRVHPAGRTLSQTLIFLLLKTKYPKLIKDPAHPVPLVNDIYQFFLKTKTCGMGPGDVKELLFKEIAENEIFDLFSDYQETLAQHHYHDPGDLYLKTLNLLKENVFRLPDPNTNLYLAHLYPLGPGHREIIRELKKNFAQLTMHIFYDETFTQEDQRLDAAYEDLGRIAETTHHHQAPPLAGQTVLKWQTPLEEIRGIVNSVTRWLKDGGAVSDVGIVVPNTEYLKPLSSLLNRAGIPACIAAPVRAADYPGPPLTVPDAVNAYRDCPNSHLADRLRAAAAHEDFVSEFEFLNTLFSGLSQHIPPEEISAFLKDLWEQHGFVPNTFAGQAVVTTVDNAIAFAQRKLFFPGLAIENLMSKGESQLYSPYLTQKKELFELIEPPQYRFQINRQMVKQLISLAPDIVLSTSEFDFAGRPLTPIDFASHTLTRDNRSPGSLGQVTTVRLAHSDEAQTKDYFKTKKKTFSISELEEYLRCPYRYYARYHLKLGSQERDDIDAGDDVKGSFVHKVLYRLIKENESHYLEGLEYESYRKKVTQKLAQIIQQELDLSDDLKEFDKNLVQFFAYRVYKTICQLVETEAAHFKARRKQTVPRHYEWSFGHSAQNLFEIKTATGNVVLRGRIDRIDVKTSQKAFAVIDYKTGNFPSLAEIKTGHSLQLPLYLLAVKQTLYRDWEPAGAYYYGLKENEIRGFAIAGAVDSGLMHKRSQLTREQWDEMVTTALKTVDRVVKEIHAGNCDPNPAHVNLCSFCDYKRICGFKPGQRKASHPVTAINRATPGHTKTIYEIDTRTTAGH